MYKSLFKSRFTSRFTQNYTINCKYFPLFFKNTYSSSNYTSLPANTPDTGMSSIENFDLRVGLITAIAKHPNAESLYVESIDLAEPTGPRQVLSGLVKYLPESALLGERVIVCCNLKAAKMRGMDSYGMLLCADKKVLEGEVEVERVVLVKPPATAPIGERISIEGFAFDPSTAPTAIDGRKGDAELFARVFGSGELASNGEGIACWRGIPLMTSAGPCSSELKEASIH